MFCDFFHALYPDVRYEIDSLLPAVNNRAKYIIDYSTEFLLPYAAIKSTPELISEAERSLFGTWSVAFTKHLTQFFTPSIFDEYDISEEGISLFFLYRAILDQYMTGYRVSHDRNICAAILSFARMCSHNVEYYQDDEYQQRNHCLEYVEHIVSNIVVIDKEQLLCNAFVELGEAMMDDPTFDHLEQNFVLVSMHAIALEIMILDATGFTLNSRVEKFINLGLIPWRWYFSRSAIETLCGTDVAVVIKHMLIREEVQTSIAMDRQGGLQFQISDY